jgi:hypothetical protein
VSTFNTYLRRLLRVEFDFEVSNTEWAALEAKLDQYLATTSPSALRSMTSAEEKNLKDRIAELEAIATDLSQKASACFMGNHEYRLLEYKKQIEAMQRDHEEAIERARNDGIASGKRSMIKGSNESRFMPQDQLGPLVIGKSWQDGLETPSTPTSQSLDGLCLMQTLDGVRCRQPYGHGGNHITNQEELDRVAMEKAASLYAKNPQPGDREAVERRKKARRYTERRSE